MGKAGTNKGLKAWEAARPRPLAPLARNFIVGGKLAAKGLDALRSGELARGFGGKPPPQPWLRLYRSRRRVLKSLLAYAVRWGHLPAPNWPRYKPIIRALDGLSGDELFALLAGNRRGLSPPLAAVVALFDRADADNARIVDDLLHKRPTAESELDHGPYAPELKFFVLVWLPVWLLAKDAPARVLRAARQGDLDALDLLLRLDKHVLYDPKVRALFLAEANNPHGARFKRIGKALASTIPKRTAAQCKTDLLALLSNYFEQATATGQAAGITAVELRALADAAAFDESDGRQLADHQLPAGNDALRKRLLRARRQWKRGPASADRRQVGQK
jgi:hypothetical protein